MFLKLFFLSFFLVLRCAVIFSQWQPDLRLTNNPSSSMTSYNNVKSVASYNNYIHLVWYDDRDGNYEIYYRNSTNYGLSWNADVRLTNAVNASDYPALYNIFSYLYLVWEDFRHGTYPEVYFKKSTNNGSSWSSEQRLTNNVERSEYPDVCTGDGATHVVWQDNRWGNYDIFYKRSTDGGATWEDDVRLTTNSGSSKYPSVTANGPIVNIIWTDNRDGNNEIYYKRSSDGGITWGADTRLTSNASDSDFPCIESYNSDLFVCWHDNRDGNYEIYMNRSPNNGINWGADQRVTNDGAISMQPSLAVWESYLHISWEDTRDLNSEQYYKRSSNYGNSWSTDTRLTNSTGISTLSSVAVWGSFVNVVWFDNRDGNNELYFKRNPSANPPSPPNLILPPNYSTGQPLTPLMDWDSLSVSSSYRIQISTDSLFSTTNWDSSGITPSNVTVPAGKLLNNTKYFWRVSGMNASGTGPYSVHWNFTTALINIAPIGNEIPTAFKLHQNYPNPFNPATKLKFDIPKSSFVKITVFDILGREVSVIANQNLNAGSYETGFDARRLASGIYFYVMKTENFNAVKKMIIMK